MWDPAWKVWDVTAVRRGGGEGGVFCCPLLMGVYLRAFWRDAARHGNGCPREENGKQNTLVLFSQPTRPRSMLGGV